MASSPESMLDNSVWAVVGDTENRQKFGYKVAMLLGKKGYQVYGINPKRQDIKGIPCYPGLDALPEVPDVVILVVAPEVMARVAEEALGLGIQNFWIQPGAGDERVLEKLMQSGAQVIFNNCVVVERNQRRAAGFIKSFYRKHTIGRQK